MKNRISFLIATNRPYDLFARRVVDSLHDTPEIADHEIVVCGTEPIHDSRVLFVEDTIKVNGPQGFNIAAQNCNGDYLAVLTDDHYPYTNYSEIPKLFESEYFKDKKYKIATAKSGGPCYTGDGGISSYLTCRFPILTRETFVNLGNQIFHPNFKLKSPHYADHFLSYFLGINDNQAIELPLVLRSFQDERPEYKVVDYREQCLGILRSLASNYLKGDSYVG